MTTPSAGLQTARPTVDQIELPEDALRLATLPRLDYTDAFTVAAHDQRSPREWIRAVLQEAPPKVRRRLVLGWAALGLRLAPPWASDSVLGWKVQQSEEDFVLLGADSWLG